MAKLLQELTNNETFELFALLKDVKVRTTKTGKQFLDLLFADRSGEIGGKFWDASAQDVDNFQAGKVVLLKGKKETYMGNFQIKISAMRLATDEEPHDAMSYVQRAPLSKEQLEEQITQSVFEIEDATYNRIVRALLQKYGNKFYVYPAAKSNHHDFEGGLAYHTVSMLALAHDVVRYYDGIDAPLLYAGTILHDLGKVVELSGPISTSYTLAGNLIGHVSIMDAEIVEAAEHLGLHQDDEQVLKLRHMILSHHGELEYGSPERPELLEAEILHNIDMLDAGIMMIQKALAHTEPGDFSDRIFGLDNRRFYKSNSK
ncbi:HD domain-containing protein [Lentilactobacillus senioris]|uniref:3'-5' exoribonuclease YhaM family protein n=1 Tax=Lentilactobacillus senioris TaxID=931534 RepID=UPI0022814AE3|nr:HD domain-containing protein [Lentilactobacillus senioris]MCY9806976.1 HD domain-containing protein [Lentilactobacillus senioris]